MDPVFLTKEDYGKFKKELEYLKGVKRTEISKKIREAREEGDLKENAGYDAAKEAQAFNEKRISELENYLAKVQFLEYSDVPKDKISIGSKVIVCEFDTNEEEELTLVSAPCADYSKGKISVNSPIGEGLLNHKVNDIVEIKIPAGIIKYKIVKII